MSSTDKPKIWKGLLIVVLIFAITGFITPTFWSYFDTMFWWGYHTADVYDISIQSIVCFVLMLVLHAVFLVFTFLEKKKPLTQGKPLMLIGLLIFIVAWTYFGLMYSAYDAYTGGSGSDFTDMYNWGWGISALLIDPVVIMLGGYVSHYQGTLHS
ncbi:MAG: hypothetical protein ACFFAS_05910 [Promethearchaeota archaeon]